MRNGKSRLAELERRIDQRFEKLEGQFENLQKQLGTMQRSIKSLRFDVRVLIRFVGTVDQDVRRHHADETRHVRA